MHGITLVEGAAAMCLAAVRRLEDDVRDKNVVVILCGGNIDPMVFARVIENGMAVDGRLLRFTASIRDRPGGLHHLVTAIASAGASVRRRPWVGPCDGAHAS